ncbi:MAG: hypothetical protein LC099_09700 [Anaerolineales bacterium]|nr:hypothetical protein [Anaerolineales bacterium]
MINFRKFRGLTVFVLAAVFVSSCNIGATPPPTQDVGAIQTQSVGLVLTQAALQMTQTAAAIPPTALPTETAAPTNTLPPVPTTDLFDQPTITPFAFNTQQPGLTPLAPTTPTLAIINTLTTKNGCNDALYLGETAPYDHDPVKAGKEFQKAWTLQNKGTCIWDEGYSFDYLESYFPDTDGTKQLKGYDIVLSKSKAEDFTKPNQSNSYVVKLTAPLEPGEYKGYWKMKDDAGEYFGPLVYVWIKVEEKK